MRKTSLFLLLLFIGQVIQAQTWAWAKSGTGGSGNSKTVATDAAGNVYIAGSFDDGHITFGAQTLNYQGQSDAYLTKYDASGNVLWATSIGGACGDYISSICVDKDGNVFVTGYYCSFNLNAGGLSLSGYNGVFNVFLARYDSNGNALWVKSSAVCTCSNYSNSVATDAAGNCYITGSFTNSTLVFGGYTLNNAGAGPSGSTHNIFITKYDAAGNILWAKKAGGADNAKASGICVDATGNAYITGTMRGNGVAFDGITLNSAGDYDNFIAKYDASGNVLWAKNGSGTREDAGNSVACDAAGNIYATGFFRSATLSFDGISVTNTNATVNRANMYLVKLNSSGTVSWVKNAGGTSGFGDEGHSLASYSGGVYVSGKMNSNGFTLGSFTLTPAAANYDPLFIANYNVNGDVVYATFLQGGATISSSICTDNVSNLYVTSSFNSSLNPFSIGATSFTPTGIENVFLAKLTLAFSLPVSLSRFTATPIDRQISIAWRTEQEINIEGYHIQKWNGNAFVSIGYMPSRRSSFANEYSFTDADVQANTPYQYRLAIVENGVINKYSPVRTAKINDRSAVLFTFANPVKDNLEIYFTKSVGKISLSLVNNKGQAVYSNTYTLTANGSNYVPVNMSGLPPGVYWLNIKTAGRQVSQHVIKN